MEDKNVIKTLSLKIEAGKATVSSLEGTDLGSIGINLQEFCSKYNAATKNEDGYIVPVIVYIYDDDTFGFSLEDPIEMPKDASNTYSPSVSGGYSGGGSPRNTSPKKEKSSDKVSVKYDSVIASVNEVIKSINGTSFLNNSSGYSAKDSTAPVLNSMDKGESYLRNVSSNLLYQMSVGTGNIETMLNTYAQLDADLASVATGLNDGLKEGTFGAPSATIKTDNVQSFQDIANINTNLFNGKVDMGKAGKISLSDLNGIITSKNSSLNSEIEDAGKLNTSLVGLLNNPDIQGTGWESLKKILEEYKGCNEVRSKAALKLKTAYEEAAKVISDYIAPDEDMDDGRIPEFEEKITNLEQEMTDCANKISALEDQNARLASVEPSPIYEKDEEGKYRLTGYDYTTYRAARAQISSNNTLITETRGLLATAKAAKEEAERYLERLKGLADIMNRADQIIDDAITDIENMYAKEVYNIDTPRLQAAREAGKLVEPQVSKEPKKTETPRLNNQALNAFVNQHGTGKTVKIPFVNAKGEKVKITVTLFGPEDTIGVGTNGGSNMKASTVFKQYGADVVMNCALNSAPILLDGQVVQGIRPNYLGETSSHKGMEALCQKQDGTLVTVPYTTSSDPNGKNFLSRLKQGYINENGQREDYKFVIGGYYNIVDKNGNYKNHKNGYIDYQEHPRSMILQTKGGYTYLITAEGRNGKTQGTTMKDMYNFAVQNLCDKNDIQVYYNGDGGSSTAYKYVDDNGNVVSANSKEWKDKRKVYVYGVSHI